MENERLIKRDTITLSSYPGLYGQELRIDLIAEALCNYFSTHQQIPRVKLRNAHRDEIIESMINDLEKNYIINYTTDYTFPKQLFNVFFVKPGNEIQNDFLLEKNYSYVVVLDETLDAQIAEQIVVAWGCWHQNRAVTKPIN